MGRMMTAAGAEAAGAEAAGGGMDPSQEELAGFRTLQDLATWSGMQDLDQESSAFRVLFTKLGYRLEDHPRSLAILSVDYFEDVVNSRWRIPAGDDVDGPQGASELFSDAKCQKKANNIG